MTAMVTGATGFVGSAIARALLNAGRRVRVLARPGGDRRNLTGLDVEIAEGDLTDAASLDAAVEGCDAVFHAAADYRLWVPDPAPVYRTNVDGTRQVLRAAAGAGVRRVVYTSSVATLGVNSDGTPANEETPVSLDDMIGAYKRSKFQAEQIALQAAADGQDIVIVNPSAPVGPHDIKPTPTGQMILDAAAGRMPAYVDTGLNIVHVDDVAAGHLLAEARGKPGRRYILGCENMSLAEIFSTVAEVSGVKAPRLKLPIALLIPVAHAAEAWARLAKKPPFVTVDGLKLAKKHMYFSSQRAIDELRYQPRPALEALRDAVRWFREHGYLP